ncbi:DUF1415 domain-containing protein [Thalassotalea aquiviva]|uniref:DUF1415 domain-containing protein n=1 Tax=Thalassotalea aquiviva TaxID=3242415 RepID=UPI00352B217F
MDDKIQDTVCGAIKMMNKIGQSEDGAVVAQTKLWLEQVIIKLNFCPFAKKEFVQNTIAYPVIRQHSMALALEQLQQQFVVLDNNPKIATSLVIFPEHFNDFYDFLDLVDMSQALLESLGYEGIYQIATFHPNYVFEGVPQHDASHFTNRSPYPTLHLIREDDMERAVKAHPDPEGIPDTNIKLSQELGAEYFQSLLLSFKQHTRTEDK